MKPQVVESETAATDVDDLRAFCRVVDLGSITGAAKVLGETKGGVSRRITRLERSLGVVLLRRSPRLVQATEDGAAYRASVGRALEMLDEANALARRALTAPSGHIRVTAPSDVGLTLMPPVIASFADRYPDITVEMVLTERLLDFDADQIDVAFRAGTSLQDSSLVAHRLLDLVAKLYASPEYLKKHRAPKRPEDLDRHRLLIGGPRRGPAAVTLRRGEEEARLRVGPHPAISGSDFAFVREVALDGGGIGLLPNVVARNDVRAGRLVEVMPDWSGFKGTLFVLHHASRVLAPKVRVFREHVIEEFTERCKKAKAEG